MASPIRSRAEVVADLTRAGEPFEICIEEVLGHPAQVFKNQRMVLGDLLEESVRFGDDEYLVAGELRLTFNDHLARVRSIAAALRSAHRIGVGDRVMILAQNSPEWIMSFWAITALGAIAVGGNSMAVGAEIEHQISLTDPKMILADRDLRARLAVCDINHELVEPLEAFVEAAVHEYQHAPAVSADIGIDDPAVIIFTSGTTGRPKGSMHSHRNVISAVWFHQFTDAVGAELAVARPRRTYLMVSPLFHIASLHNLAVVRLVTGDKVVMSLGKFSTNQILSLIEQEKITNWGAVPTMISRILSEDTARYDLTSLQTLTVNSAPSSPTLKSAFRERFGWLAGSFGTTYGLTESSSAATVGTPAMLEKDPESVGTPVATMEIEIRGDDGTVLADGQQGEVFLRGSLVMIGYYGLGERAGIDEAGWFGTGDIGVFEAGELRLRSRRSDLILRGAENVYPAEVENAIVTCQDVQECIVFGVSDEEWGQQVAAIVVPRAGAVLTPADIAAHLTTQIAKYKRPVYIKIRHEQLRRNATGKVVRRDPALVVDSCDLLMAD